MVDKLTTPPKNEEIVPKINEIIDKLNKLTPITVIKTDGTILTLLQQVSSTQ